MHKPMHKPTTLFVTSNVIRQNK